MIPGLDSSIDRPTPAQAAAAYGAGVRAWGGYLATRPGVGLYSVWDRASFQVVQDAGLLALGFCSGNDDPAAVAALARRWNVLACLDDEDGIRPVGGWEQGWLNQAGGQIGLYGNAVPGGTNVHAGVSARFHIAAWYPGFDPHLAWPWGIPRPATPLAWQWRGTHQELGLSVDAIWLDDWFMAPGRPRNGGEMGFLSRDAADDTLDELYVSGGEAYLGSWPGGAGDWINGSSGSPGRFGSPEDAHDLVEVSGGYGTYQGTLRLNIRGVRADGSRWILVVRMSDFAVLQAWTQTATGPNQDPPSNTTDASLRRYLRDTPA